MARLGKKKRSSLSKGEMVVAGAVWRLQDASLGEIHEAVNQSEAMEYATVQSYIRRLVSKGYVKAKRVGRNNRYQPRARPETVIGQTIDQLLNRLFAGDAMPVFRHLINEHPMSQEQIAELRRMIDESEQKANDD